MILPHVSICIVHDRVYIWASSRENLSWGCPTERVSNQSPQLQRLARKLNFTCSNFTYDNFQKANNKGADQTAQAGLRRCCSQPPPPPKDRFSRVEAHIYMILPHVNMCTVHDREPLSLPL